MFQVFCRSCGRKWTGRINGLCECGGLLDTSYDHTELKTTSARGMWKYRGHLPVAEDTSPVTLGEGATPLHLSKLADAAALYLKDESQNPTGSVKDRALSLAVTKAKELNIPKATLFSAGSTGLAAAAYAARADLDLTVFVGAATPVWRFLQMKVLGAHVVKVQSGTDELMNLLEEIANERGVYQLTTCRRANPYQAEAPKTIAYEVVEQLGDAPDWFIAPIGGGGTLCGVWKGFTELQAFGRISKLPRILGVQVEGYDALAIAFQRGIRGEQELMAILEGTPEVDTCCTKLTHKFPHDSVELLEAVDESNGAVLSLTDRDALEAMRLVGRKDGLFIEPSSALAVAGFLRSKREGLIAPGATVVSLVTGSAFRELPLLGQFVELGDIETVAASKDALRAVLEL